MLKIGLLSDTHGWLHPRLFEFFAGCDEIWHAGDIGSVETADALKAFRPFKAVCGNIDGHLLRSEYPSTLKFTAEEIRVLITHIGGPQGKYEKNVRDILHEYEPGLFVCGHSHIAKVIFDRRFNMLYVNPGASGYQGFHKIMTAMRFTIDGKNISGMEIIELGERGKALI